MLRLELWRGCDKKENELAYFGDFDFVPEFRAKKRILKIFTQELIMGLE